MYIIYVRPLSDVNPRTHSGVENRHGNLGTAAIVLASAPEAAPENLFNLTPGAGRLARTRPQGTAKKENT
jgi:hypothetical protein